MSELRWILLAAGVLLVAGIYFFGRPRRPPSQEYAPLTRDTARPDVPELAEAVVVRARVRDPVQPIVVDPAPDVAGVDDLPSMTVHDDTPWVAPAMSSERREPSIGREPSIESLSTGAFIAAQASESQASESYASESQAESVTVAPAAPRAASAPEAHSRPARRATGSRKIIALRLTAGGARVDGSRLKMMLEATGLTHGKYSIYHRLHGDSAVFSVASMVEPGTFDPQAMGANQFPGVTLFTQIPGALGGQEQFDQMLTCARELEKGISGILQDERGLPLTEQREQRLRDDIADFEHLLGSA